MKVYIGYYCYNTSQDTVRVLQKVFDDEVKAVYWVDAESYSDDSLEWREYVEMEVE